MNRQNFTRLALGATLILSAIGCDHDKGMRSKLPDLPPPPAKTSGCPQVDGIWGTLDKDGKATPVAVFDKSEQGFFRYTNLDKYEGAIIVGENAVEVTRRDEVKESIGIETSGMMFCREGAASIRYVESGPDSSLPDRITVKRWTFDSTALTGQLETTWPDGTKSTESVIKVVLDDKTKE
jgi:hypothetical protein